MREWIVGRNPIYESLRAGRRHAFRLLVMRGMRPDARVDAILQMARQRKLSIHEVGRMELDELSSHNQGLALEVSEYPYAALEDIILNSKAKEEAPFFLLLDLIQDPQNLGSLLRTAEIMAVHGVIIPSAQATQITPSVVHASSGATEHLLVAQYNLVQAIERLKKMDDLWVYGLEGGAHARRPEQLRLKGGVALVVGNEGAGLRDLVRKNCDELLALPQYGQIESMNAAVAGSIALYLVRQAH